ncbi:CDGSH iron-sulfur domain-containing protein [Chroococcidiopsis sp. CCMEE 29]|uniref:CDGSH iron-sulfur domain-containing protein n=1 Tax=Chroococcidiopsis sp. CCMEE 29 TaxID=155894 RepID=UPI0020212200|nr:CDGSH iron-sulfur domain-containing protein [Chroococcidiopsis sp. CCMEE 29]
MSQPNSSVTVRLDAGTHWICSCGSSKNFPHCDGTHQGTQFQPLVLELEVPKVVEISK